MKNYLSAKRCVLTSAQKKKVWELLMVAKKCMVSTVGSGRTAEKGEDDEKGDDRDHAGNQFGCQAHQGSSNKKKGKKSGTGILQVSAVSLA